MTRKEADPHGIFTQKVLAVDFDGVIMEQCVWTGKEEIKGGPVDGIGMVSALRVLKTLGWKIIVWSARAETALIKKWLKSYGFDNIFDAINENPWAPDNLKDSRKIPAHAYLDDRNIPFTGNWDNMANKIQKFKPYWERN